MKICICGNMAFSDKMQESKKELETLEHTVFIPLNDRNLKVKKTKLTHSEFQSLKKRHFNKINNSDAILVLNYDKNGIKNYIGSSTFGEICYALAENKSIFLLNPIPDQPYISEDLDYFDAKVINGDLTKIN